MPFGPAQAIPLQETLFGLVPRDGSSIGNGKLRQQLSDKAARELHVDLDLDDYWKLRDALLRAGRIEKGRGKGGAVSRVASDVIELGPAESAVADEQPEREAEEVITAEQGLYEPLLKTIRTAYAPDYEISEFVCEQTANQGRRRTGGRWTRPDISLVSGNCLPSLPRPVVRYELLGGFVHA